MDIETTYEPNEILEDHFLPIDRTVWHIDLPDTSQEAARKTVEAFKRELNQKRTPDKAAKVQPVYVPVPVQDCLVDNRTDTPSWSRASDEKEALAHPYEKEHVVMRRIKSRIEQIEKIDRRTWGLYYGAVDVWSIISSAFWNVAGVLNAIRFLAVARVRRYFSRKIKNLAVSIDNERKEKTRKARSG